MIEAVAMTVFGTMALSVLVGLILGQVLKERREQGEAIAEWIRVLQSESERVQE